MLTPVCRAATIQFLALVCSAFAQSTDSKKLAITDVTIIHPATGTVERRRTVVIDGGRILGVQLASRRLSSGIKVVSGKGKFLIPGLWDSHVHLTKAGVLSLPLFVANGVTSVRDMGSDLTEVGTWRRQIEAGSLLGPAIRTSGQILESQANIDRMKRAHTIEPVDRIRIGVANPEQGRDVVRKLAANGVDFVKMRTTPDFAIFQAVVREAAKHNLPVAAHPVGTPAQMAEAGLTSVEHILRFPPLQGMPQAERASIFSQMNKAGMIMSDTMVNMDGSVLLSYDKAKAKLADGAGQSDSRHRYVCGYLVEDWREQVEEKKGDEKQVDELRQQLQALYADRSEMRQSRVTFLAGTDVGVAFMYPGFSLHDELNNLVEHSGSSPMEALRIATVNPYLFFGKHDGGGAIVPGASVDLVLLTADPLESINNTSHISGVMAHGKWMDRNELDRILQQVKTHAKENCKAALQVSR